MAESEFSYSDGSWRVTEAMKEAYHENGYIIVRNMFNNGEVAKVRAALEDPNGVQQFSFSRSDGKSRDLRFVLWNHPGRDVTGVMARTQRVAGTAEEVPDAALMECREVDDLADKWFMRNDEDHSVPRNLH